MRPESRAEVAQVLAAARAFALVNDEAVDALYQLPPASVDLMFADPPYNLSNGGTTCRGGKRVAVHKGDWDKSRGLQADHEFHRAWLTEARRILKPTGTLWVSGTQHVIFSIGFALQMEGWNILNTVTWFKPNASPNLGCRQFTHSSELLIWAAPAKADPLAHHFAYAELKAANGGKQMRDVWELPADGLGGVLTQSTPGATERERGGGHPTQKPEALLERVIRASSKAGDVVLDPFNGSGTTGAVAVALGRRYIGIDSDGEHIAASAARLQRVRVQHLTHR